MKINKKKDLKSNSEIPKTSTIGKFIHFLFCILSSIIFIVLYYRLFNRSVPVAVVGITCLLAYTQSLITANTRYLKIRPVIAFIIISIVTMFVYDISSIILQKTILLIYNKESISVIASLIGLKGVLSVGMGFVAGKKVFNLLVTKGT
jgi:hypothetical protein